MGRSTNRIMKAALIAFAAGAVVAVDNPVRPIDHDFAIALTNVTQLTADAARAARSDLLAAIIRHG